MNRREPKLKLKDGQEVDASERHLDELKAKHDLAKGNSAKRFIGSQINLILKLRKMRESLDPAEAYQRENRMRKNRKKRGKKAEAMYNSVRQK